MAMLIERGGPRGLSPLCPGCSCCTRRPPGHERRLHRADHPDLRAGVGNTGTAPGQFSTPAGVAADALGNVYVADLQNQPIQKFDRLGNFVLQWGSNGSGDGQFSFPSGVAVDAAGNVFVTEQGNHRVQKFSSSGAFIAKWGSLGSGIGQFSSPYGVAVDAAGNVYVADQGNNRSEK